MSAKYIALTVLFIILGIAIALGYLRLVNDKRVTKPNATETVQVESQKLETAYYTAILPAGYTIQSQNEPATTELLMETIAVGPNADSPTILISLHAVGGEGLSDIPLYRQYASGSQGERVAFGGTPVAVETFTTKNTDSYEVIGFWRQGGIYAIIRANAKNNQNNPSNQIFAQIVSNWQWR